MIDPQLQGVKWIKNRESNLKVVLMNKGRWMNTNTQVDICIMLDLFAI